MKADKNKTYPIQVKVGHGFYAVVTLTREHHRLSDYGFRKVETVFVSVSL